MDFSTRLTGFDSIGDHEVGVRLQTRRGTERCGVDRVVLAAGSWSAQLGELAGVTAFGFVVLAIVSAAVGYLLASLVWRWMVARKRLKKLRERDANPASDGA